MTITINAGFKNNYTMNVSYINVKVNVKSTLEQATKAQRGSRCIDLLFLQPHRFTPGKDPVPIV